MNVSETARLACLHLSKEELQTFEVELQAIFNYFDHISSFSKKGLEPLVDPLEGLRTHALVTREDKVSAFHDGEQLLALAPDRLGTQYRVPPVVE